MVFTCRDEAVAALTGPDADARKAAADYLAEDGGEAATQALVAALGSSLTDIQINAAEALGNCRNLAAIEPQEIPALEIGEFPAIEALAFAAFEIREYGARRREKNNRRNKKPRSPMAVG